MVSGLLQEWVIASLAAIAEEGGGKLPEPTRAAAMMALLGIALLGMLLVVVILLGGHWVRRQGSHRRATAVPRDRAPVIKSDVAPPPDASANDAESAADTVHDGPNHGETKVL